MKSVVASLLGSAVLTTLAGCSSSVAAPMPQVPTKPQVAITLAPQGEVVSDNPIKIPEGRKTTPPAVAKPVTAPDRNQDINDSEEGLSPEAMPQQERKQDRQQEKFSRKNGMRQDGRQFDNKQEGKQKSDRFEKVQVVKKPAEEPSAKPVTPAVAAESSAAPAASGATTTESAAAPATPAPVPAVAPAATTPASPSTPVSFSVTYGSSANAASRNYKKPTLPSGLPSWFTDNDKDGDGQLSMNEWPGDRFDEFSKYDRNGDGIITIEEAMKTVPKAVVAAPTTSVTTPPATTAAPTSTAAAPPKVVTTAGTSAQAATGTPMSDEEAKRSVEQVFSFVDNNKDGFLDEKEIANTRSIKSVDWKKYDTNKDGKLDMNEAIALYKAEGANFRRGGMGGGPGGGGWGNVSPEERAKTMFDNMDKNKTGKITKEQFPGFWRDRFAEFDTNKDGFVDFEEFKVGAAKMMAGGPGGRGGPGGGQGGPGGARGGFGGGDNGGRGGRGGDNGGGGRGGRGGFGGGNG